MPTTKTIIKIDATHAKVTEDFDSVYEKQNLLTQRLGLVQRIAEIDEIIRVIDTPSI